jgi:hypothetical protein
MGRTTNTIVGTFNHFVHAAFWVPLRRGLRISASCLRAREDSQLVLASSSARAVSLSLLSKARRRYCNRHTQIAEGNFHFSMQPARSRASMERFTS